MGKCENTDVYKYKGSGVYWSRHIKKHGYDVTTEILLETTDKDELIKKGVEYSILYNIVEDDSWANLKIEEGDGGDTSKTPGYIDYRNSERFVEVNKESSERMKINNPMFNQETVAKVFSGDIGDKISKALTGKAKSEEHKEKLRIASLLQSDTISKRTKALFNDNNFKHKCKEILKNVADKQINMSIEEFESWICNVNVFNSKGVPNSRVKRVIDTLNLADVYYKEYYESKKKKRYTYYKDCDFIEFEEWITKQKLYRNDGNINPRVFSVVKHRNLLDVYYEDYLKNIEETKNIIKVKKDTSGVNNVMSRIDIKKKHLESVNTIDYKQKMSFIKTGTKQSDETKEKIKNIAIERNFGKWNKGVPKSESCKLNQSKAALNRERIECEHCGNKYTIQNLTKHINSCIKNISTNYITEK